ncbi:MAG: PilZ domain-containing protein [Pseudomonadota bacterium]
MLEERIGQTEMHPLLVRSEYDIDDDERLHRRVQVELDAQILDADGAERVGKITNISVGSALIACRGAPEPDSQVVLYVEHLGRLEGIVRRETSNSFAVEFITTPRRRAKLAGILMWVINRPFVELEDHRQHRRTPQFNSATTVEVNGNQFPCEVKDLSVGGACIRCAQDLPIGTVGRLGKLHFAVVRRDDNSTYGVEFRTCV